jgi:hypothetical protein
LLVLGEPPAVPLVVKDPNNPLTLLPVFATDPGMAFAVLQHVPIRWCGLQSMFDWTT